MSRRQAFWEGTTMGLLWLSFLLLLKAVNAAPPMVADIKSIAADGSVLNAVGCSVSPITIGPESNTSAPVLTAVVDCRSPTVFGDGYE